MKFNIKSIILLAALFLVPSMAEAHPGNTDSSGGHHCWTNCEDWGYEYGEYHNHNGGYDYEYEYSEEQMRKDNYQDAVREGEILLKLVSKYNQAINSGNIKAVDGLYDELRSQLDFVQMEIGEVYGSANRDKLSRKYINPSKSAIERTIYEVSQLRLLGEINNSISYDDTWGAKEQMAQLNRMAKRAEQIKKSGGYKALPPSINHYLRQQEAISQGNMLLKVLASYNEAIDFGYIDNIDGEYDYFTNEIKLTQAKIGKVYGETNRNQLNSKFIKPSKVAIERTIYEISQHRLLNKIENLLDTNQKDKAGIELSKLNRLKKRAVQIKETGGYKAIPSQIQEDLDNREQWIRHDYENDY